MVRLLHRAWSRCKAGASAGPTTRKEISTPLSRVSVRSLFMPVLLYPRCLYRLGRGVRGTMRQGPRGSSPGQGTGRDAAEEGREVGPDPRCSKGTALGALGPYLAVDLLDEGLAVLVVPLELAHLLELLGGKALDPPGNFRHGQLVVVRGPERAHNGGP